MFRFNPTYSPLPSWVDLFKAFFFVGKCQEEKIASFWGSTEKDLVFWFSRTTWSFFILCKVLKILKNKNTVTIWIPSYFCDSALMKIRRDDVKLIFYEIDCEMKPNWEKCNLSASLNAPDIFILVHYFGACNDVKHARKFCDQQGALLVEDGAHVPIPSAPIGEHGDIVLYSPHKSFAIPDGSLVIVRQREGLLSQFSRMEMKEAFELILADTEKGSAKYGIWLFKRIVQKIVPGFLLKNKYFSLKSRSVFLPSPKMSNLSKRLLSVMTTVRLSAIANSRRDNLEMSRLILSANNWSELRSKEGFDGIPYCAVFSSGDNLPLIDQVEKFQKSGLPVFSWPDLPCEVLKESDKYQISIWFQKHRIMLPIHQGIDLKSVFFLVSKILQKNSDVFSIKKNLNFSINSCLKYPIVQDRNYCLSKEECFGWKANRFFVFKNGSPIATMMSLEKRIGFLRLTRINRGPSFFDETSFYDLFRVFKVISKRWNFFYGNAVVISPELGFNKINLLLLNLCGFHLLKSKGWSSSVVDLNLKTEEIYRNLRGKWRNQIKHGERAGLILERGNEQQFDWFLKRHLEDRKSKNFSGIDLELLRSMRRRSEEHLILFLAREAFGDHVAGVLIGCHGKGATYLVGWNGDRGRQLNANNFLLWNVILNLKETGITFFDVGGIDAIKNQKIAEFKRGLSGSEYTLVGEYWR